MNLLHGESQSLAGVDELKIEEDKAASERSCKPDGCAAIPSPDKNAYPSYVRIYMYMYVYT